jgi:hypothetical protein
MLGVYVVMIIVGLFLPVLPSKIASTIRVFFFDSAVCRPHRKHLTSKDQPEIADRQDETPALAGPADRTRWKGHPGETCSRWSGARMRQR